MDIQKVKALLAKLGKDADWLAQRLSLPSDSVHEWLGGNVPEEGVNVVLQVQLDEKTTVPVPFSLEDYLEVELKAAALGISLERCVAQSIRASISSQDQGGS